MTMHGSTIPQVPTPGTTTTRAGKTFMAHSITGMPYPTPVNFALMAGACLPIMIGLHYPTISAAEFPVEEINSNLAGRKVRPWVVTAIPLFIPDGISTKAPMEPTIMALALCPAVNVKVADLTISSVVPVIGGPQVSSPQQLHGSVLSTTIQTSGDLHEPKNLA